MSNATFDMGLFTAPDRGDIFRHVILINDAQLVAFDLKTLITKKKSEATREELASAYVPGTLDRYCRKLMLAVFHLRTLQYQALDISLPDRFRCEACKGTGIDPVYEDRCSVCNGLGIHGAVKLNQSQSWACVLVPIYYCVLSTNPVSSLHFMKNRNALLLLPLTSVVTTAS